MGSVHRFLSAFAILLACAAPAPAQDAADKIDCSKPMSQPDLNDCAYSEYEVADAALNATYKKAVVRAQALDGEYKDSPEYVGAVEALKNAQRAWITYRDGHCVLAGFQARGGQAESMLVSGCLAEMTRKRTAELTEFLETEY